MTKLLLLQLKALKIPEPTLEYRFAYPRRWRFDLAWPDDLVALEIEGAVWTQGRHTRGKGFEADMEKYNAAAERGWFVFRFSPQMVKDGRAAKQMERVFCQ